ncbi:hypothetical protein C1645_684789 [Glomus cerebriforme]|uniref:Uncharacterized protein n=1 Tax=Glomus cerebriforme TaxID=658196 RepID=A0A397TMU1_9GLOM|nr:hypothetical protein C1645_684789 [Glomus cerebriforme]
MLDVVLKPQLKPEEKKIVQVTHDECHFYANDGQRKIWIKKNEDILRSKHIGHSIIVLAFLYPYYRLLQLSDEQLQVNPHIKHKEAVLMHQAISIFEILHPGCTGVFCFDQSTNHNAIAGDALVATKMNLSPRGKQPKMCDG